MNRVMSGTHNFLAYVLTDKPGANSAIGPRIRLQQHLDLSRLVNLMALITVFNTAIKGYIAFSMTTHFMVFAWVLTNLLMAAIMMLDYLRKAGRAAPQRVSGRYVRRSETLSIFAGFLFGSLPLYLFGSDAFATLILSTLFTVSMCAGLMCLLPRNPRLVMRYMAGSITPLLIHVGLHFNDKLIAIAIALTLLVLMIYFGARSAFKLYLKEVELVREATQLREILDVALDGSGQAVAVRSKDGEVIFENALYQKVKLTLQNMEASCGVVHALDRYWQIAHYQVSSIGSVEIFTDVTRIEDSRQEAESLRQGADEASLAKTRFLRSITSELLVPLRTIRLLASLMDASSQIPVTKADMNRACDKIRLLTEALEGRVEQIIGHAGSVATQTDVATASDLCEPASSPVLKVRRPALRQGLRSLSGS